MQKDLTQGKPIKVLLAFTMPMLFGNLFQQLYNVVDTVVVGKFVGEEALAGVGSSFPIFYLMVALSTGMSMGCSVVISQYLGAERHKEVKLSIYTALITFLVAGCVMSVFGQFLVNPLLEILGSPPEIIQYSRDYLMIIIAGIVFAFLYNVLNAIFTALGDSKTPMVLLIIAALINVVLDLYFVIGLGMSVKGVAYATVIAQAVAALVALYLLWLRLQKLPGKTDKYFNFAMLKKMVRMGIPSTVQQTSLSIGMLAIQSLVNSFGSIVVAGFTAAQKIDSIAMLPLMSISNALSTFTAQNIGANKIERIKEGYLGALKAAFISSILVSVLVFLFGYQLIGMFVDSVATAQVFDVGVSYMRVISLFYFLLGIMFATNGVLRGSGDVRAFLGVTVISLGSRILFAYLLSSMFGYMGIVFAIPIGWIAGDVLAVLRYRSGVWKSKAIIKRETAV